MKRFAALLFGLCVAVALLPLCASARENPHLLYHSPFVTIRHALLSTEYRGGQLHGQWKVYSKRDRGWYETHSVFRNLVLPAKDGDRAVRVNDFIDSIDLDAPIDEGGPDVKGIQDSSASANEACGSLCTWRSISEASDGAIGVSLGAKTWPIARKEAYNACEKVGLRHPRTHLRPCINKAPIVTGTRWIAAVYCRNAKEWWAFTLRGKTLRTAIRNDYREAHQKHGFTRDDCLFIEAVGPGGLFPR